MSYHTAAREVPSGLYLETIWRVVSGPIKPDISRHGPGPAGDTIDLDMTFMWLGVIDNDVRCLVLHHRLVATYL